MDGDRGGGGGVGGGWRDRNGGIGSRSMNKLVRVLWPVKAEETASLLKCCFTSIETVRLLGTGAQDGGMQKKVLYLCSSVCVCFFQIFDLDLVSE